MNKEQFSIEVTQTVSTLSGVKGFLVKKLWPIIKDLVIDLLIDELQKRKQA